MNAGFQRSLAAIAEERSLAHPADAERALQRGLDRYRRRIRLAYGVFIAGALVLAGLLFVAHHIVTNPQLTEIALASDVAELQPNAEAQLTATGIYSDGTGGPLMNPVTWTSDNPTIVTVDPATGKITGMNPGDATITASADGVTGQIRVTVTEAKLEGINVKGPDKMAQGTVQPFVAIGKFSDGTTGQLAAATWKSNKPAVATVDSKTGEVTGESPGEATITATSDGQKDSKKVVVTAATTDTPPQPKESKLERIVISGPNTVTVGQTEDYSATGVYSNGTEEKLAGSVKWTSSDPAVATIDPTGGVTGISSGDVTITASQSGITSEPKLISVVPAAPTCTPPAIVEAAYTGKPVSVVEAELTALGIQPVLEGQVHEQVAADTVLKVIPKCTAGVWEVSIVYSLGPAETPLPTPSPSGP